MAWTAKSKWLDAVKTITSDEWIWPKNFRCKYVEFRVDTRDGAALIKDREGNVITIEQLLSQKQTT